MTTGTPDAPSADETEESGGTVALALAANVVITIAKIAGGLLSGSSALLSEGAHSVADVVNELLLVASLKRSRRPADAQHPFGYGKERYFWALLAAVGIFVAGAGFSAYEGIESIRSPEADGGLYWVVYLVLFISVLADGSSWLKAIRQLLSASRRSRRNLRAEFAENRDTTLSTVVAEDSAGVLGVVIAALGVGLHEATGNGIWEGIASLGIALLLVIAAGTLGRKNMRLLVGQSAEASTRLAVWDYLAAQPIVADVLEVLTMQLAPDAVLVAARVDLTQGYDSERIEVVAGEVRAGLAALLPPRSQIFLDVTDATDESAARGQRIHQHLRDLSPDTREACPEEVAPEPADAAGGSRS